MRFAMHIAAGALAVALAAPAQAGDRPDPFAQLEALINPRTVLQGVVREEDVALLFAHLRAVLFAAAEGRETPVPDEINQRAQAIGAELKARGMLTGLAFLTLFEAVVRQAVRETLADPAPPVR